MRAFLALAALALLPAGALAQTPAESASLRVTLQDALARAEAESHRLAELRAREGAAGAVVEGSRAAERPILAVLAGYQRTNHVDEFGFFQQDGTFRLIYPDIPDNWRARLDMQWPIYTAGRADALERAARAEQSAAANDLESARADLRLETTRAFWALVTATESVRVVRAAVERVESQLRDVRARFEAGFLPPNDVLTVESRLSQQRTALLQAENVRDAARAELARLIGARLDAELEADAVLAPDPASAVQADVQTALAQRADRKAVEDRVRASEARIDAVRAERRPTISLAGGFDYARPNPRIFPRQDRFDDAWDVGVNVSWTFWNAGRTSAAIAEARLASEAARARLADVDSRIALEIRQRQLDLNSARAQVETAGAAVAAATEARRVVEERVRAGVATTTELLDAQVDQLQAELDRTRALAAVKLAEAQLARALGR